MEKVLICFAAALAIGVSAIATAWAQSRIGAAGAGTIAERPEMTGTVIILLAIPETMVILGFVVAYAGVAAAVVSANTTSNFSPAVGAVLLVIGVVLLAGGIALAVVGGLKLRSTLHERSRFGEQMNRIQDRLNSNPGQPYYPPPPPGDSRDPDPRPRDPLRPRDGGSGPLRGRLRARREGGALRRPGAGDPGRRRGRDLGEPPGDRKNLESVGLSKTVSVIEGDALKVLPTLEGGVDFVFIDALKPDYMKYYRALEPKLTRNATVVADNVIVSARQMRDFLEHIQTNPNYDSVVIRASLHKNDGMLVAFKIR